MTTEPEQELMNVVAFPMKEGKGKSELQFIPEGDRVRCFHPGVWVNEKERQIRCRRCEAVLDPFDYLLSIARKEVQLADKVGYLRIEEKQRRQNIDKLIQIERNAKSRIRRSGVKEPLPLWQNEKVSDDPT